MLSNLLQRAQQPFKKKKQQPNPKNPQESTVEHK